MKKSIFFLVALAYFTSLKGQERPPEPISPNAAAMTQNINVPVNEFTGQMSYSVPLHTIALNDFQLPIALNYSYSGLKVEEYPTEVGMGWSLVAGGVINRTVRGIPDEDLKGYKTSTGSRLAEYAAGTLTSLEIEDLKIDISSRGYDPEMDLFRFNVPGHSGQFYYEHDKTTASVWPETELVISGVYNPSYNEGKGEISSFLLKDLKGNRYAFLPSESAYNASGDDDFEGATFSHNATTWYLDKIETRNRNVIQFNYSEQLVALPRTVSEEKTYTFNYGGSSVPNTSSRNEIRKSINEKVLNSITVRNSSYQLLQTVNFIRENDRLDWNVPPNNEGDVIPKILSGVEIIHSGGEYITYELKHSYFGTNDRLRLDKVYRTKEANLLLGTESDKILINEFEYNAGDVPGLEINNSFYAQDYWGYYNGKTNNNTLIIDTKYFSGADRTSNQTLSGSLKRIIYPTGGYTEVSYEGNDIPSSSSGSSSFEYADLCSVEKFTWIDTLYANSDNEHYSFTLTEPKCIGVDYKLNQVCGASVFIKISGIPVGETTTTQYLYDALVTDLGGVTQSKNGGWSEALPAGDYSITFWSLYEGGSGCAHPSVEVEVFGPYSDEIEIKTVYKTYEDPYSREQVQVCTSNGNNYSYFEIPQNFEVLPKILVTLASENNIKSSINIEKLDPNTDEYVSLMGASGSELMTENFDQYFFDSSQGLSPSLTSGSYRLVASVDHLYFDDNGSQYAEISLSFPDLFASNQNPKIGGIRIRALKNCDKNGSCVQTSYLYRKHDDPSISSGILVSKPKFSQSIITMAEIVTASTSLGQSVVYEPRTTLRFRSSSTSPLSSSNGSHIVYPAVTVIKGSGKDSYTSKKLFSYLEDIGENVFPYPPLINQDYVRGKLLNEQQLNSISDCSSYGIVRNTISKYSTSVSVNSAFYSNPTGGIKFDRHINYHNYLGPSDPNLNFTFSEYKVGGGPIYLHKSSTFQYKIFNSINKQELETEELFQYDSIYYKNLTKRIVFNSNGDVITTHYKYPQDGYLSGTGDPDIVDKTIPIEQYSTNDNTGETLNFKKIIFDDFGTKHLPSEVYQSKGSSVDYEKTIEVTEYDESGNVVEIIDQSGVRSTYIWGYNRSLLVAKIDNLSFAETSAYIGSANLSALKGIPSENLILSVFDNLRDEFPHSRVTSYVQKPLVGPTLIIDPNKKRQTYEYDSFGRLITVLDHEGNILKKQTYHYQK